MTVEDFDKYMALSKVLNNSWGTGSQLKSASQSIKFALRDDKLMKVNFVMIVIMPNNQKTVFEMTERFRNEALQMVKAALTELRERFEEANGETITLKMLDSSVNDGVEFLTNAQYRPTKHAYFRLTCLVEVQ